MFGYFHNRLRGDGLCAERPGCHILSIDVEDWPQSTLDHSLPIGERVVANTRVLLDLLGEAGVRATFFVLGKVAERHPRLAAEIAAAGHEVATHGYWKRVYPTIRVSSPSAIRVTASAVRAVTRS